MVAMKTVRGILASVEFIDRVDAYRTSDAFKGAQFAKEGAGLNVGRNKLLPHPQAAGQNKIDVAVALRLANCPCASWRFEPSTLAIEILARFRVERFEARVD